jgi:pimeloyl-ACP methyl ester carboxylesterase
VIALDSRGRGRSAYDPNPKNYTPAVELTDLLAVLNVINISQAVFVGSSRGGILTMLLAPIDPEMIAGAVLHDIGPVIESQGVARINSYVGKLRLPRNLQERAVALRELFGMYKLENWYRPTTPLWRKAWLISTSNIRYRHCGTSSTRSLACRSW